MMKREILTFVVNIRFLREIQKAPLGYRGDIFASFSFGEKTLGNRL